MSVVKEGPVLTEPNGLYPQLRRLVLRTDGLLLLHMKNGKVSKLWQLEQVVEAKEDRTDATCFEVTTMDAHKKPEPPNFFEVRSHKDCVRWIKTINKTLAHNTPGSRDEDISLRNVAPPSDAADRSSPPRKDSQAALSPTVDSQTTVGDSLPVVRWRSGSLRRQPMALGKARNKRWVRLSVARPLPVQEAGIPEDEENEGRSGEDEVSATSEECEVPPEQGETKQTACGLDPEREIETVENA